MKHLAFAPFRGWTIGHEVPIAYAMGYDLSPLPGLGVRCLSCSGVQGTFRKLGFPSQTSDVTTCMFRTRSTATLDRAPSAEIQCISERSNHDDDGSRSRG